MKTKNSILLMAIAIGMIGACKKETAEPTPVPAPHSTSAMGNFFSNNGVTVQHFTIDATTYQVIQGTGGTIFYISPNSFVTSGNGTVTGNISIELKELYSKKDMILTGVLPMSGHNPLVSGGEFFVKATQGSQTLKLSGTSYVQVEMPAGTNPPNGMQEFYSNSIAVGDSATGWTTNSDTITVVPDSSTGNNYYYFQIDSMNWVNCDYYWNDPAPKTMVTVNPGISYNDTNCVIFMSVNGQNTIGRLYHHNNSYSADGWPTGKAITFVAISEINGQYYSAFKPSVITGNQNETLTLTATTLAQIKQALANLP